jgi:prevent-host-death family protein
MKTRVVSATELKSKCLALLDEVDDCGHTITVTKRGRPVATLQPVKKKCWKSPKRRLDRQGQNCRRYCRIRYHASLGRCSQSLGDFDLAPRILLDTHILVRWLADPRRLSREQARILKDAVRRREAVAISAITLLEIAMLFSGGLLRTQLSLDELFEELEGHPTLSVLPLTIEVAKETSFLGSTLRDPADRVIVATARVHGLRVLTSDQRIIESKSVSAVD